MSAWRDRRAGGMGVASLAVMLGVCALAGCGSGDSSSAGSAATSSQAVAPGKASASTSAKGAADASAQSTAASRKAPAHNTARASVPLLGGHLLRRFTGSGNTGLGTIVVSSPAVLAWRVQRPPVQVFTARGFLLVSSHGSVGSVQLSRGSYSGTRVATHGSWTLELRTRS